MMLSAKWAGFFEFGAQIQVLEMVLSSVEGSMNSEMALMSFSEAFFWPWISLNFCKCGDLACE
jgi:hypothetical protein